MIHVQSGHGERNYDYSVLGRGTICCELQGFCLQQMLTYLCLTRSPLVLENDFLVQRLQSINVDRYKDRMMQLL